LLATPLLFISPRAPHRDLHSFPTRRSSDLAAFEWRGGKGTLVVAGTVASGVVVKLQMSPDAGTTWVDVAAAFDEDESPEPLSVRSEEHTSELQSRENLVCRLLLEKKKTNST